MPDISKKSSNLAVQKRATVKNTVHLKGIGIHSGTDAELFIHPAPSGSGLVFDVKGVSAGKIPVSPLNVIGTMQQVVLGKNGAKIQTVEHLLAALSIAGVSDAVLEVSGEEVPILDGSAWPYYEAIEAEGISFFNETLHPIIIKTPLWIVEGERYLVALPDDECRITYSINFDHKMLKGQGISINRNDPDFAEKILKARTFGMMKDVNAMKEKGLIKGGSLENALVLTDDGYLNESLRYKDECVRHKVLDLVGDLNLLNRPVQGHIIASKAGHKLDVALTKKMLAGDLISAAS